MREGHARLPALGDCPSHILRLHLLEFSPDRQAGGHWKISFTPAGLTAVLLLESNPSGSNPSGCRYSHHCLGSPMHHCRLNHRGLENTGGHCKETPTVSAWRVGWSKDDSETIGTLFYFYFWERFSRLQEM